MKLLLIAFIFVMFYFCLTFLFLTFYLYSLNLIISSNYFQLMIPVSYFFLQTFSSCQNSFDHFSITCIWLQIYFWLFIWWIFIIFEQYSAIGQLFWDVVQHKANVVQPIFNLLFSLLWALMNPFYVFWKYTSMQLFWV